MQLPSAVANRDSVAGRIVLLMAGGPLGTIMVNGLTQRLGPLTVIEEQPEAKRAIIRRRARLLGWPTAVGQIGLGLLLRATAHRSRQRLSTICRDHGLDPTARTGPAHHRVTSVNAPECHALLRELAPKVVAVYGTRLLTPATLAAVPAPVINYHAGITPMYRGQHPAYWALTRADPDNAGVTIHLVDRGVDTGGVLHQARTAFSADDTIATYQHVQMATALPLFARAIEEALAGRLAPRPATGPSANNFPPTLWRYLATGLRRGVW